MNENGTFRDVIEALLLPMFPQAVLTETQPRNSSEPAACEAGYTSIRLQLFKNSSYAFKITRTQAFTADDLTTMKVFVEVVRIILPHVEHRYVLEFVESRMSEVVARALDVPRWETIAHVIDTFLKWSQETYEGRRIACAIGISPGRSERTASLSDYLELDLAKVVSDGHSSIVVVSNSGSIICHKYLEAAEDIDETFAPFAFIPVARWANNGKVAIALNRSGEILIFANGSLVFARRRGAWHQFSHRASIRQMALHGPRKFSEELRTAAYLTSIDISFARMGGAIGLVERTRAVTSDTGPLLPQDLLTNSKSPKNRTLMKIIGKRKFFELGRPLRQELGGIDGAVVIDHAGTVLAAGAILSINLANEQGGRRAAARTLGAHGLGIKISSDGKIEAFSGDKHSGGMPIFALA